MKTGAIGRRARRRTRRQIELDKRPFAILPRAPAPATRGRPPSPFSATVRGLILIEEARSFLGILAPPKEVASYLVRRRFPPDQRTAANVERMLRWLRRPAKSLIPGVQKSATGPESPSDQTFILF